LSAPDQGLLGGSIVCGRQSPAFSGGCE